jgi:serine/threonine protein kinase
MAKIDVAKVFNCADLSEFIASVRQILPWSGISGSRFYKCEYKGVYFITKMCFYAKSTPQLYAKLPKGVYSFTDTEINILKILKKKIIDANISICIVELIYVHTCDNLLELYKDKYNSENCRKIILEYNTINDGIMDKHMCRYIQDIKLGLAENKCAFMVLEECSITFDTYLQQYMHSAIDVAVFKSLLFHIIYTFYAITKIYPKFRHYDLHTSNIMLNFDQEYKYNSHTIKYMVYNIDGVEYNIPYFGIIPKIIDFGFSSIPEEDIISAITIDRIMASNRHDVDIIHLFGWILTSVTHHDTFGHINRILEALDPTKTYRHGIKLYVDQIKDQIPTCEQMLKNKIFSDYTEYKVNKSQIFNEFTPLNTII